MPAGDHSHHDTSSPQGRFWTSRTFFVFLAFLAISVFLLLSEHRAHVLGAWPFLLLLACPLMHIFMHRGHGGHGSRDVSEPPVRDSKRSSS
ncbi:MAG: DUF2933 domain-containing protein [Hyphomicrobium sp.]